MLRSHRLESSHISPRAEMANLSNHLILRHTRTLLLASLVARALRRNPSGNLTLLFKVATHVICIIQPLKVKLIKPIQVYLENLSNSALIYSLLYDMNSE